jgi:hypothetical protein
MHGEKVNTENKTKISTHTSTVCLSWCKSGATSIEFLSTDRRVEPHQQYVCLLTQKWSHINSISVYWHKSGATSTVCLSVLLMQKWSHINSISVSWHKSGATSTVCLSPDKKVEPHQYHVFLLTQKWSNSFLCNVYSASFKMVLQSINVSSQKSLCSYSQQLTTSTLQKFTKIPMSCSFFI